MSTVGQADTQKYQLFVHVDSLRREDFSLPPIRPARAGAGAGDAYHALSEIPEIRASRLVPIRDVSEAKKGAQVFANACDNHGSFGRLRHTCQVTLGSDLKL